MLGRVHDAWPKIATQIADAGEDTLQQGHIQSLFGDKSTIQHPCSHCSCLSKRLNSTFFKPKWYSRQGSWHKTCVCYPQDGRSSSSFVFLFFKFKLLSFIKINVIEIVLSCFLIFKIKETKDYVTSLRAWTCDFLPPSWSVSYVISLLKKHTRLKLFRI